MHLSAGRSASLLHSKGSHGTPRPGGGLDLNLVEAAYLVESGRLRVSERGEPISLPSLLARGGAADERFETKYLVYREFRERGFVIRAEPASARIDFSVRARGSTAKAPSSTWVLAVSERGAFSAADSLSYARRASGLGKQAFLAVADEEGDVTFYALSVGLDKVGAKGGKAADVHGTLAGDRVIVEGEAAKALGASEEMLGKPFKEMLRLSLVEAAFLVGDHRLSLERPGGGAVTQNELLRIGLAHHRDFALRVAAYRDLRHRGLLPKTGFKYGSDFRVYDRAAGAPHARYLVHAVPSSFACPWAELARAVRLAHGVRKRLVLALVAQDESVEYLHVSWARP